MKGHLEGELNVDRWRLKYSGKKKTEKLGWIQGAEGSLFICVVFMKRTGQWGRKVWIMFRPWGILKVLVEYLDFIWLGTMKNFQLCLGRLIHYWEWHGYLKCWCLGSIKLFICSVPWKRNSYLEPPGNMCCVGLWNAEIKKILSLTLREPFAGCAKFCEEPRGMACYFWWGHSEGLWVASSDCLSQWSSVTVVRLYSWLQLGPDDMASVRGQFVRITGCEQKSVIVSISST